jgi:asparagine synthase (glutamine-hydrolysing)
LPEEIIQRPKKGFETPMDQWFQREMKGYVAAMLLERGAAVSRYFDRQAVKDLLTAHIEKREDYRRQLFSLLTFEIWHRVFIDKTI